MKLYRIYWYLAFAVFLSVLISGITLPSESVAEEKKNKENDYYEDGSIKTEYLVIDDDGNALEYISYTGAKGRFARLHHVCTYDNSGHLTIEKLYLDDGMLWQLYYGDYDDNGYLTRRTCFYEENGDPVMIMEYERNSRGECIRQSDQELFTGKSEETYFDMSGKAIRRTIYSDGAIDYSAYMTYDPDGYLTEYKVMNADGSVSFVQLFQYDEQGRTVHSKVLDNQGEIEIDTSYEYIENSCIETEHEYFQYSRGFIITEYIDGIVVSRKHYDEDKSILYSEIMNYDNDGNLDSIEANLPDGTEKYKIEYTYNSRGTKIMQTRINADGTSDIQEYNDFGICIKDETRSVADKLIYEALYDEYGRRTASRFYDEESGKVSHEMLYNKFGNEIRWNIYEDGELVYYELYEYDENNNRINETKVTVEK